LVVRARQQGTAHSEHGLCLLCGAFLVGREVVRQMITRDSGKIINIASVQSELEMTQHREGVVGIRFLLFNQSVDNAKHAA
jgi:NAD(P)-dependent dehydrogenase (short-subunit alcohol dehydrogenase family)